MAEQIIVRAPENSDVYCYDDVTDADEVNTTLHRIVQQFKMQKHVWVVSGTHGTAEGTVDPDCEEQDFKYEDLDSANVTSKNVHILSYHLLAPNRWAEIAAKRGDSNVIVLAFCYSQRWYENDAENGNGGRI